MTHPSFSDAIPDDRLYCTEHDMWVQPLADGEARIGATGFGLYRAGEVIAFTAKPAGAEVAIGRGMGTVECRKTLLAVHAPISLRLLEGNAAAEDDPARINADPYGTGWMARVRPTAWAAERGRLVDAAAYRAHIRRIEPEARFD